jgi:uncharacterized protein (DUF433 family)
MKQKVVELATGIVTNPSIRSGHPVIRGTRVPVDMVVGRVAAGMAVPAVAEEYGITEKDVYNALRSAASHRGTGMGDSRITLRFLTDEDVPRSTARALRDAGFDAVDVRDVGLRGKSDALVFAMPNVKNVS